ncbi:MAG: ThiF family adenylyltransferase [Sphingopyxis sp.]|jgi:hypothetical protein
MTANQADLLARHLFPDDGCEAVALLLCGRRAGADRHRLLVRRIVPIPYAECSERKPDLVTWPTRYVDALLEEASRHDLAIVKIHGHRGYDRFSETDDLSDRSLFPGIAALTENDIHGSAIMMDDGRVFGRLVCPDGEFLPFSHVAVIGDDLKFYRGSGAKAVEPFGQRIAQSFGAGTYRQLRELRIAVIGCSGTGSLVIEQLARNCVGVLILVDPDHIEPKNLNRIVNSRADHAAAAAPKVDVQAQAIAAMGLGTTVETYCADLFDPDVVRAIAECDVVFGCMDSVDGRHLLNKLATFYLLPYFDLGVKLEADGEGGVDQVCGTVHYIQPGGSSLLSRHVYTAEQVRAAGLYRTDRAAYKAQLGLGYIRGVAEDRPAVIQLNALIASLAINELLARLHPYRLDPNSEYAIHRISLSHGIYEHLEDGPACAALARHIGRGDVAPLLDWAELSETEKAA